MLKCVKGIVVYKILEWSLSREKMLQHRKYMLQTHSIICGMMMHGLKFLSEKFRLANGNFLPEK